jgi:hypothetical protein
MIATADPAKPRGLALLLGWSRVRVTLLFTVVLGFLIGMHWTSGPISAIKRTVLVGFVAMLIFGLFEQWPKWMPRWLPRWILQVVGVAVVIPPATAIIFALSTPAGEPPFFEDRERMAGFGLVAGLGVFFGPWVALGALVRQKEALAEHQALAFDLERSELARQASDARLRLLQAQVAPHFLFNTLANVQALVDEGSPQAPAVLRSLVAYLRAAVPRLDEPVTTLGRELALVRAYLELMHMRMPDRLQFAIHADEEALALSCPPMTLLTLVENAVRHGIDPSEEGGRIDIDVRRRSDRCAVRVSNTGAGLQTTGDGLGTGLSTLRERLHLTFGGDAHLSVSAQLPQGVSAELDFPARNTAR